MPKIASIENFEDLWVQWWATAQPEWRDTKNWPFSQYEISGDWGTKLSGGGKDGIFLVVMSIRWWAHAQDRAMDSKLNAAIGDVRKLEHQSHFSSFSSLWTLPLFLSLATFPLYVLPNRPHSPPSLVFIVASSLT